MGSTQKYYLGKTSLKRLDTCSPILKHLIWRAMETWGNLEGQDFDWGIICGFRDQCAQNNAYAEAKSNARWGESHHNVSMGDRPYSLAVDLAPYDPTIKNYLWHDREKFQILFAHILLTATDLELKVKWGADFNGRIKGGDMPHLEMVA